MCVCVCVHVCVNMTNVMHVQMHLKLNIFCEHVVRCVCIIYVDTDTPLVP